MVEDTRPIEGPNLRRLCRGEKADSDCVDHLVALPCSHATDRVPYSVVTESSRCESAGERFRNFLEPYEAVD